MIGWIVLAIIVVVIGYGIYAYNNLVSTRQLSQEGWSGIDVQLKRRADLIPNLRETVKGYMSQERARLEGALTGALGRLLAVAEAYPDLKANTTFLEFQGALQKVEDELQMS